MALFEIATEGEMFVKRSNRLPQCLQIAGGPLPPLCLSFAFSNPKLKIIYEPSFKGQLFSSFSGQQTRECLQVLNE